MKNQNDPLWRKGQEQPSESSTLTDAEREAQQQNQKSYQQKRSH